MKDIKIVIKNVCIVLAFPIIIGLLMEIISLVFAKEHLISTMLDIRNLIRNSGIATCITLALSFNIPTGRMDLSLGAQRVAATIIGGNIALLLGLGGVGIVIFATIFGLIFGSIVGILFVTLRIPPMVLGVGMALVFECIGFASFNSQGLQIYGAKDVDSLSNMGFIIGIVCIIAVFNLIVVKYTTFGYHQRAIQGSQKIAHNSGINIFRNAVICYMLAGGFASVSGVFDAAYKGALDAGLGLSSTGTVMANCFPLFLGGYIARWCNQPVGIIVACITLALYKNGLSALNLTTTATELASITTFLLFLIFLANQKLFKNRKEVADRIQLARQTRSEF